MVIELIGNLRIKFEDKRYEVRICLIVVCVVEKVRCCYNGIVRFLEFSIFWYVWEELLNYMEFRRNKYVRRI